MGTPSEQSLNFAIYPVRARNAKALNKIDFPVKIIKDQKEVCIIDGIWDNDCMIAMDILCHQVLKRRYGCEIPKCHVSPEASIPTYDVIMKILEGPVKSKTITFDETELREEYMCVSERTPTWIYNAFKKASSCRFKIIYRPRYYDPATNRFKFYTYNTLSDDHPSESFFNLDVEETLSNNGRVRSRKYHIHFESILGNLFGFNTIGMNIIWNDDAFYLLTPNAQLFKRLFLNTTKFK